eukprot:g1321.t1
MAAASTAADSVFRDLTLRQAEHLLQNVSRKFSHDALAFCELCRITTPELEDEKFFTDRIAREQAWKGFLRRTHPDKHGNNTLSNTVFQKAQDLHASVSSKLGSGTGSDDAWRKCWREQKTGGGPAAAAPQFAKHPTWSPNGHKSEEGSGPSSYEENKQHAFYFSESDNKNSSGTSGAGSIFGGGGYGGGSSTIFGDDWKTRPNSSSSGAPPPFGPTPRPPGGFTTGSATNSNNTNNLFGKKKPPSTASGAATPRNNGGPQYQGESATSGARSNPTSDGKSRASSKYSSSAPRTSTDLRAAVTLLNLRGAICHGRPIGFPLDAKCSLRERGFEARHSVLGAFSTSSVRDAVQAALGPGGVKNLSTSLGSSVSNIRAAIKEELMEHGPVVSVSFRLDPAFAQHEEARKRFDGSRVGGTHPLVIVGWEVGLCGECWLVQELPAETEDREVDGFLGTNASSPMHGNKPDKDVFPIGFGQFQIEDEVLGLSADGNKLLEKVTWQPGPYLDVKDDADITVEKHLHFPPAPAKETVKVPLSASALQDLFLKLGGGSLKDLLQTRDLFVEIRGAVKPAGSRRIRLEDVTLPKSVLGVLKNREKPFVVCGELLDDGASS